MQGLSYIVSYFQEQLLLFLGKIQIYLLLTNVKDRILIKQVISWSCAKENII